MYRYSPDHPIIWFYKFRKYRLLKIFLISISKFSWSLYFILDYTTICGYSQVSSCFDKTFMTIKIIYYFVYHILVNLQYISIVVPTLFNRGTLSYFKSRHTFDERLFVFWKYIFTFQLCHDTTDLIILPEYPISVGAWRWQIKYLYTMIG